MKLKCVMQNEQIDSLITNHSLAPLPKQEQMQVLDDEAMESSSKIDLRDVSWWMFIKDACRPRVLVITTLSKEVCISLITGRRSFRATRKHD
jgi:hypothetical protein